MSATSERNFPEKQALIKLVHALMEEPPLGVLSTVSRDGNPELRWMSTLSLKEFPIFYTLTPPESKKVAQLKLHPYVNWMFSDENLELIINFQGKARILEDTKTLKRIWQQIKDKSRAYFLNQYVKGPGFVVIETTVEKIEVSLPKTLEKFSITIEEFLSLLK